MESNYLQPLLSWLHAHPHWVGLAVFSVCFVESLAIVGLFTPGVVMMTAIGTLLGSGILPAGPTLTWAILGSVAGDYLSFWLGHHYHQHIRDMWPFRKFPLLLAKGEAFFQQHGGKSVFLGRFAGPVRAITPLVAGMLNMSTFRFIFTSIGASILWAPAYMLPGIVLGAASQQLSPETATRFLGLLLLSIFILWFCSWLVKRLFAWKMMYLNLLLSRLWQIVVNSPSLINLRKLLQDPSYPESHAALTQCFAFFLSAIALLVLINHVLHEGVLTLLNVPIHHFFHSLRHHTLDRIVLAITLIGELRVMLTLLAGITLWLMWKRLWRASIHWLACGSVAIISGRLLKIVVQSPRPTGLIVTPTGWSFPSGHTTLTVALFGFFAVLISRSLPQTQRWIPYFIAASFSTLVALSRLYLEAHWLTDVVGGALLGLLCVLGFTLSYHHKPSQPPALKSFLIVGTLILTSALSWYSYHHYRQMLYYYTPANHPPSAMSMQTWWFEAGETPPYYRTDRFGRPVQAMNIQWAGDLHTIEKTLQQQGWEKVGKLDLASAVTRIASDDPTQRLPLFAQLYQDQKPVLVMTKFTSQKNKLLVLRLWSVNVTLSDPSTPFWVGTVAYLHPWKPFSKEKKHTQKPLASATAILVTDLQTVEWKYIDYPHLLRLPEQENKDWDGGVLFIRSKVR